MKALLILTFVALAACGSAPRPAPIVPAPTPGPLGAETATGVMPKLVTIAGFGTVLDLAYPRFAVSGQYTYYHRFAIVFDQNLAALRTLLEAGASPEVTVTQAGIDVWRVVSWRARR